MINKLFGFMCITNPQKGSYPYLEAIESHLQFLDKLYIVDGGSLDGSLDLIQAKFKNEIFRKKLVIKTLFWPQGKGQWTWEEFSKHWNYGLELCKQDGAEWVCATECDHIFHERESILIKLRLETRCKNLPIGLVDKLVSSTWYKWKSKTKMPLFLNVKDYPNIGYGLDRNGGSGQDLTTPLFITKQKGEFGIPEGTIISHDQGHNLGIYMWNYDKTFKTKEQILETRESCNWAWNNSCLTKLKICPCWKKINIFEDVITRMISRYNSSPYDYHHIYNHPAVMESKLESINESHLGYNLFTKIND